MTRCAKVFIIFLFVLTSVVCVVKLSLNLWSEESSITELEIWLEEYDLLKYKNLFFDKGKLIFLIRRRKCCCFIYMFLVALDVPKILIKSIPKNVSGRYQPVNS